MNEIGELGSVFNLGFLIDAVKMVLNRLERNEQFFADLFIGVAFEEGFDDLFFSGGEIKFVYGVWRQAVADDKWRLVEVPGHENRDLNA